ncbi:MAG: MT-A70 family methyltransferase [Chloroflexota bacterium]
MTEETGLTPQQKTPTWLVHFDTARQQLALAKSVDEVKQIRDQAEALKAYISQQGASLEMQNEAAEIKLRAERKAGEMLAERENHPPGPESKDRLHDVTYPPALEDLLITKMQSHRWQLEASLPDDKFEEWVTDIKSKNGELTSAGLRNLAVRHQYPDDAPSPPLPEGEFDVIHGDPPWQYENIVPKSGPAKLHYGTMSIDRLCDLEIPAADNATLFLWVTNPLLEDAFQVIDAWGFEYKSNIAWIKTNLQRPGAGWYARGHRELLLICVRGSHLPVQTNAPPISSVVQADAPQHSRKPEVFYDIIERMYPNGTYVELFARNNRPGWTSWGLEANEQNSS